MSYVTASLLACLSLVTAVVIAMAWWRTQEANERLRATTDHARALLDALGQPVLVFDENGHVREANGVARAWLGPVDTLPAWLAGRLVLHGTAPDLSALFGRSGMVEGKLDEPGGGRTVQVTVRPGRLLGGELGMVAGIADVTALKRAQESGARAAVAEREANQTKSQFLANMSHELRTPLNAIIGYTELLLEDGPHEHQLEDLHHIRSAGGHLLNLINQVLDLSKLEAGKLSFVAEEVDLDQLVGEVVDTAEVLARRNRNVLVVSGGGMGIARLDGTRLRQVLLNLLSNASKFTHEGRVVITGRDLGRHVSLSVTDTGVGIAPDAIERLFQPFVQADATTSRQYGGTGLGLAIARHFVERMGGTLTVESVVGVGSTFTVHLPRTMPTARPTEASPRATTLTP
jgi:signal transduction histidine kinase